MKSTHSALLLTALAAILATGCAAGKGNPATPSTSSGESLNSGQGDIGARSNRLIWGFWDINISADHRTVEVVPARSMEMHLNVVRLIEVTPCATCLTIGNVKTVEPNVLEADLTLIHPYPGLIKYTGFDVRGIFIAQGNFTFPVSGRNIAYGTDVPMVLNADGYTPLFNPIEFPETQPGPAALRYIPGKYATGGDLSATLNPFVAYRRDAPRRMFEAGGSETRTVRLYAPSGPIHFGYAVDACWQSVDNVIDPLIDFPPDANCLEAYGVSVEFPYDLESSWMSQNPVNVEVFDHQGLETISAVSIEAPDLFTGEVALAYSVQTGEESWLFSGMVPNEKEAIHGDYPALVRVIDSEADQNLGEVDAWAVTSAGVKEGWARTWGGSGYEAGNDIAVDGSGNIYVTGRFQGTVDFDPGDGIDNRIANSLWAAFLAKFDSSGDFIWVRTWGAAGLYGEVLRHSVSVDGSGNVYVAGEFESTVDFDPGSGVDEHASNGSIDVYVSKFDSSGNFLGTKTWGGSNQDNIGEDTVDNFGSVYVTGWYHFTVDFDPGDGVDNHISSGVADAFLSKFDSSGTFLWTKTWGDGDEDYGQSVAADVSGNVYVTGCFFSDVIDLDPGSGIDDHTGNGKADIFLTKFDSSGAFQWGKTWGGTSSDESIGVAVDGPGCVYVTGTFSNAVDFDPGAGVDAHASTGHEDVFLSKFDSLGGFQWAKTWGGGWHDIGYDIALDESGNAYVTGEFEGTVDFDPGIGVDSHTPDNGSSSVFLSKFDSTGAFLWAKTWSALGWGVVTSGSESVYVTGEFPYTADFDPGSGVDSHTSNGLTDAFLVKFLPDGNW
jgi:hypothetical protein